MIYRIVISGHLVTFYEDSHPTVILCWVMLRRLPREGQGFLLRQCRPERVLCSCLHCFVCAHERAVRWPVDEEEFVHGLPDRALGGACAVGPAELPRLLRAKT